VAKFEAVRTYLLKFEEEEYQGLEIRSRGLSIANLLNMTTMSERLQSEKVSGENAAENVQNIERLMRLFSDSLIEWNITNLGEDVPATYEGVMAQDIGFMLRVIRAYTDAIVTVPDPLEQRFSDGGQSPEHLMIPMEPLSASLAS
jgi:hypothetical protein